MIGFSSSTYSQQWNNLGEIILGSDTVSKVYEIDNYGAHIYLSTNLGLFRSADNGNSWSNLTWQNGLVSNQMINNVYVNTTAGIIYVSSDSSVYKSIDNGVTWNNTVINGNLANINHILKSGSNIIVAYGDSMGGGVMYSSNGLSSVSPANIPNLQMNHFLDGSKGLYVAGKDGIYFSNDNGLNWAIIGTGHPIGGNYSKIVSSGIRIIASDNIGNGVYHTDDYGLTWVKNTPATHNGVCKVFDLVELFGIYISVMDGNCNINNPIKKSIDNAVSWSPFMNNLSAGVYKVLGTFTVSSCFFTFDEVKRELKRYCGSVNSIFENQFKSEVNVFPNPSEGTFNISSDKTIQSLTVFNSLGKVVLSSSPNKKKLTIDLINMSGIYFVQFETDKSTSMKKIFLK